MCRLWIGALVSGLTVFACDSPDRDTSAVGEALAIADVGEPSEAELAAEVSAKGSAEAAAPTIASGSEDAESEEDASEPDASEDAESEEDASESVEPEQIPQGTILISPRTTIVYAQPAYGSEIRGRIDPDTPFWAGEDAQGEGCDESRWAQVRSAGFVCLKHAEPSEEAPAVIPALAEGDILPFIYAKPKQDRKGNLDAEIPRYRSYRHFRRGTGQVEGLVANRQYAFVERKWRPSVGHVFIDPDGRAVTGANLSVQRPSQLFGRDLGDDPPAPGLAAGWSVSIPTVLWDRPSRKRSKEIGEIDYHERFDVDPQPVSGSGVLWYRIPGAGKDGGDAYAEAKQVRVWDPGPALEDLGDDELWLDVDIKQQTLGVRRGATTSFVTLVSSGTGKHPTPRGIFRIRSKLALGKMENKPEDPDSYYVEAVPWVQYFFRRFAFHATYWHGGLGRRRSHGCINLAPRDAAYVFALTSPEAPKGWTSVYEHVEEIGTVVRIRRGDDAIVDYRRALTDDASEESEEEDADPDLSPEDGDEDDDEAAGDDGDGDDEDAS